MNSQLISENRSEGVLRELRAVIFDLDGTLIDSAPGILDTFRRVLDGAGLSPAVPLDNSLIGPPLRRAMTELTKIDDGDELERLMADFRRIYDSRGYRGFHLYEDVGDTLSEISSHGILMAIATNKRRVPTLKILDHLAWAPYFKAVGAMDTPPAPFGSKKTLIGATLSEMGVDAGEAIYVGDKWEDGEAAAANGMPFVAAGWGYGDWDAGNLPNGWLYGKSFKELLQIVSAGFPSK